MIHINNLQRKSIGELLSFFVKCFYYFLLLLKCLKTCFLEITEKTIFSLILMILNNFLCEKNFQFLKYLQKKLLLLCSNRLLVK